MKYFFLFIIITLTFSLSAQNITVDSQTFTPQQLIEDILIDSNCIENVVVNNAVSGNFNNNQLSYGYFDATGTSFPFQSGIVMSTGQLNNVPGPNNSLSDDDAPGWIGDQDLEIALDETNTFNATILEFDFTAVSSEISFRYIFASEEYQENNPNSCRFSDLFGFLIRPTGDTGPYQNIAVVPGTDTPVKATTVTPGVSGSCPPENETYFGSYNNTVSPINFNGQTAILTATAQVQPNESYHVKLVIADEQNFRFDSAVFLEAGSFELARDLGQNRLIAANNPLCEDETLELNAVLPGNNGYDWYKDGVLVQSEPIGCINCGTYSVSEAGTYSVEISLDNNCFAYGEIIIEYASNPIGFNSTLIGCDNNQDGLSVYNLFLAEIDLTGNNQNLAVTDFFLNQADAINNTNPIENDSNFENTVPNQIIFARIENISGCFTTAQLELQTSNNTLTIPTIEACDFDLLDGFTVFNLNEVTAEITNQIPIGSEVTFYENESDAITGENPLPTNFNNTIANFQTIYVKVTNSTSCFAISAANLEVLFTPAVSKDETLIYCTDLFPETVRLFGGVLNDLPNNYFYEWQLNGNTLSINTSFIDINEVGNYTVIITDPNGCSNSRIISVEPSSIAQIESTEVVGFGNNNTVTILVTGSGNYEYTLDYENGQYQDENVFNNISPGFHTVFVRDKNGCGISSKLISVLGFPKFFTPNGDSKNDTWQLDGVNFQLYPNLLVTIYDRFGKLITTLNANSSGWDGTYNGNIMPNTDYWFTANFEDGRTFTSHFTLKR